MNYIIWNKKDKINGVNADHFINSLKIRETDGVFLIGKDLDNIQAVEIDRIIKNVYGLDNALTTEEVAKEYIKIKEEEKKKAEEAKQNIETKLKELEKENAQIQYALMMGGLI